MVLLISIPFISVSMYLPRWLSGKESACQSRRLKRCRFNPWVRKIPWSRKLQPTRIFLPEKFHGQLTVCSPRGHKESDTNECAWVCVHMSMCTCARAHAHTHTRTMHVPHNLDIWALEGVLLVFQGWSLSSSFLKNCLDSSSRWTCLVQEIGNLPTSGGKKNFY